MRSVFSFLVLSVPVTHRTHESRGPDLLFSSRSILPPLSRSLNESVFVRERCCHSTHFDGECDCNSHATAHRLPPSIPASQDGDRDGDGDSADDGGNTTPMSPETP